MPYFQGHTGLLNVCQLNSANVFFLFLKVKVNLKHPGKKLEHHGIKIELVGQIGKEWLLISFILTKELVLKDGQWHSQLDKNGRKFYVFVIGTT